MTPYLAAVLITHDSVRCLIKFKKIQKSEKNSEVGGWVQPQLGFRFFLKFCVFVCVFYVVFMFPKKIKIG